MKSLILCVSIVLLFTAGCTSNKTIMDSWVGSSIDDATTSWGAPNSRMERNDGGATYTWINYWSTQYGMSQCRRTLVTDSSGKIVTWSYAGNCGW